MKSFTLPLRLSRQVIRMGRDVFSIVCWAAAVAGFSSGHGCGEPRPEGRSPDGSSEAGDSAGARANPRVQKYVAQLAEARIAGASTKKVAASAVEMAGVKGEAAKLTVAAMLRNLTIAERMGCLTRRGCAICARASLPRCSGGHTKVRN